MAEIKFREELEAPKNEPRDFEISIIIRIFDDGKKKFAGATAQGKYLKGVQRVDTEKDADRSFIVKLTNETGLSWPMHEGIYRLKFRGDAWLDDREDDPSKHCVRIKCDPETIDLVKTHVLFDKKK